MFLGITLREKVYQSYSLFVSSFQKGRQPYMVQSNSPSRQLLGLIQAICITLYNVILR